MTVLVALAVTTVVLALWRASPTVPLSNSGDANEYGMVAKALTRSWWFFQNPDLGAPFGQQLYDYPIVEPLPAAIMKLFALFTDDYGLVINLFFLATFALVALSAFYVCTRLGLRLAVAGVVAVLYSVLPYHFIRGEGHLLLSAYYSVPLGLLLVLWSVGAVRDERQRRARVIWVLVLGAIVGLNGLYYAFFTVLLLVIVVGVKQLRGLDKGAMRRGVFVGGVVSGFLLASLAPTLVYAALNGGNREVAVRQPGESEAFGLKITSLLLPRKGYRIGQLSAKVEEYESRTKIPSEPGQAMGIVAVMGFLWLILFGLSGGAPAMHFLDSDEVEFCRQAFVVTLTAVLIAAVGGFAVIFAVVVTPQIRSWNRISVFIAFVCLVAVGFLIQGLVRSRGLTRRRSSIVLVVCLAVVLVVGIVDQTSPLDIPSYEAARSEFDSDALFVSDLEAKLPSGGMVFQLPYRPFPEMPGIGRMGDYDLLRGYLHSRDLKWSYGGIRDRQPPWQQALVDENPTDVWPATLVAVGFDAITIDRFGYEDGGLALESELTAVLGANPDVSRNGRLSFFDLADYADSVKTAVSGKELTAVKRATLNVSNDADEMQRQLARSVALRTRGAE